jgi:carbon-monoxide dehydrogenase small subunit
MKVNGHEYAFHVEVGTTLAEVLRDELSLTGTKIACGEGHCGACTVLVDGVPTLSCITLAHAIDGAEVTTIEGLADGGELSPVQAAFQEEHGLQCGFCTPGFVMSIHAFLRDNPDPTEAEIREGLSGNLCRCTGYQGIIRATRRAAGQMETAR